jgi:simple sugar transport system permease protein
MASILQPDGGPSAGGARAIEEIARAAFSIGAALLLAGVVVGALGYSPVRALSALISGGLGSPAAWTSTLLKTTPLLLTGLTVSLCFRCGVWNIGAEGQFYLGALLATAVATRWLPDAPPIVVVPVAMGAAAGGGLFWASIAGALKAGRGVSEVISTILLNFVAIQLVSLAVHGWLQDGSGAYPQSDALAAAARLPRVGRLHLGIPIALGLAVASWALLFRTSFGLRMRAVGMSARASRFAGIDPDRTLIATLAVSGGLAGLAGGLEVMGVTGRLFEKLSPGYGYTAIAVALLARLHPLAVVPSALLFGLLEAGGGAMQREAGVPAVATDVVKGVVILVSIGFASVHLAWFASRPSHDDDDADRDGDGAARIAATPGAADPARGGGGR